MAPVESAAGVTRVLILEDQTADVELIERELKKTGVPLVTRHVTDAEDFTRALRDWNPDLVISDHGLPQFSGREALRMVREGWPDLPVILVTGSLDEETAVEYMKAGAADYVLKSRLVRLGPATVGALERKRSREARDRAEAELRRSEARLKSILDAALDAIVTMDAEGRITGWNPTAEKMFGWAAPEVEGRAVADVIVPAAHREAHLAGLARFLATGEGAFLGRRVETEALHRSGRVFPVELTITPVRLDRTWIFSAFLRDLSERHLLQQQLHQAQKMEAIGRLAGGIAHDFNNIITAIIGYADLLLEEMADEDPRRGDLAEIHKGADRAASLTRQLLAFSRRQVLQPRTLDVNAIVSGMEKMLLRVIGEDIRLRTVLSPNLPRVNTDPGQLEQVILNLAVNARDAMPAGGTLSIETAAVELDEPYADRHAGASPGRFVMLAMTDTGMGMTAEVQSRLFEPFFTTKGPGKGTGLGLSTVYGIVKQSGGSIYVYSEPGRGTTFKVYLPRAEAIVQPAPEEPRVPAAAIPRGTETILLAEDSEAVRELARRVLAGHGYTVLTTRSGEEALQVCREHTGPVELLLTDVVMPEMSGRELAERVAQIRRGVRVIYMSGYTDDAVVRHGIVEAGVHYLQKPFTPEALLQKVRSVLDRAR